MPRGRRPIASNASFARVACPFTDRTWFRWSSFRDFSSLRMCTWSRCAIPSSAMYFLRRFTPASSSGKRILFVGSQSSDVHLLASRALPSDRYYRVDVGDVEGVVHALCAMERAVKSEHDPDVVHRDPADTSNPTPARRANAVNG